MPLIPEESDKSEDEIVVLSAVKEPEGVDEGHGEGWIKYLIYLLLILLILLCCILCLCFCCMKRKQPASTDHHQKTLFALTGVVPKSGAAIAPVDSEKEDVSLIIAAVPSESSEHII